MSDKLYFIITLFLCHREHSNVRVSLKLKFIIIKLIMIIKYTFAQLSLQHALSLSLSDEKIFIQMLYIFII